MKKLSCFIAVLSALVSPAFAHHSVPGMFDETKDVMVTGTISKVEWINPHIYVYVDVKDQAGKVLTWGFETLPPAMMRRSGITREALIGSGVGQQVTVEAIPARTDPRGGLITKITYPDGHYYQLYQPSRTR